MGRPPKLTPQQQKEARRRRAEGATLNALENCNAPAEIAAKRGLTVEQLTEA